MSMGKVIFDFSMFLLETTDIINPAGEIHLLFRVVR